MKIGKEAVSYVGIGTIIAISQTFPIIIREANLGER